jgi:murein DD-endopeptidase MepM/ murein hydrolase activator NlpD
MRNTPLMLRLILSLLVIATIVSVYFLYRWYAPDVKRSGRVRAWLVDPAGHAEWAMQAGQRCTGAQFIFPTDGFVGYLWGDSFHLGHRHQGIDIFSSQTLDLTPVVAAYDGYLTRLPDWKSSVIIRIPHDPLQPDRQVWTYYTHMADSDGNSFIDEHFPPDTNEVFVKAGTLLGYQGNFSGDPNNPVGVHLHFSIVMDDNGHFRNELEFRNTLDPSPYLGLPLNAAQNQGEIPHCDG